MITVVTPTGYREKQFRLLEVFMSRQDTKEEIRWITVNDGPPLERTLPRNDFESQESVVLNVDSSKIKGPTLGFNMLKAIEHLDNIGDWPTRLIIMEDDVWYAPAYITHMTELMEEADIVGTFPAFVYNVLLRRYKEMHFHNLAAWSETCISGKYACEYLRSICHRIGTSLDCAMWMKHPGMRKKRTTSFLETLTVPLAVSMKGHGQARPLGKYHDDRTSAKFIPDPDLTQLRAWIGEDVSLYYETPAIKK